MISFPRGAEAGSVPAEVVWNLGLAQRPGTSIITPSGLALSLGYRLDRRRHTETVAAKHGERPRGVAPTEAR